MAKGIEHVEEGRLAAKIEADSDQAFLNRLLEIVSIVGNPHALAKASGLSPSGVNRYLAGGEPTRPALLALAKAAGVRVEWLASGQGAMRSIETDPLATTNGDFGTVPVYDIEASAGHGALIDEERVISEVAFRRDWIQQQGWVFRNLAAITSRGDSMEPTIPDGSLVLIDTAGDLKVEDGVCVLRVDEHLMIKRLQRLIDGGLKIMSDNPAYPDQIVAKESLKDLEVVGRVIWVGHRL